MGFGFLSCQGLFLFHSVGLKIGFLNVSSIGQGAAISCTGAKLQGRLCHSSRPGFDVEMGRLKSAGVRLSVLRNGAKAALGGHKFCHHCSVLSLRNVTASVLKCHISPHIRHKCL